MLQPKKMFFIFTPALLLGSLALFVRIIQYEPLFPDTTKIEKNKTAEFIIPFLPEDPILGNPKAPRTIVAFEDFSCPACRQQQTMLTELETEFPDQFKIIWKGLPVHEFPYPSKRVHEYAYCGHTQKKFNQFKELAFTNYNNLSETTLGLISSEAGLEADKLIECLESGEASIYIETNQSIAKILNVQAVPTFFIDNKQIKTPDSADEWKNILQL